MKKTKLFSSSPPPLGSLKGILTVVSPAALILLIMILRRGIPEEIKDFTVQVPVNKSSFLYHSSFTLPFKSIPNSPAYLFPLNDIPEKNSTLIRRYFGDMDHKYSLKNRSSLLLFECNRSNSTVFSIQNRILLKLVYLDPTSIPFGYLVYNWFKFLWFDILLLIGYDYYSDFNLFKEFRPLTDIKMMFYDNDQFVNKYRKIKEFYYDEFKVPVDLRELYKVYPFRDRLSRFLNTLIFDDLKLGVFANSGSDFSRAVCNSLVDFDGFINCGYFETVICDTKEILEPDPAGDHDYRSEDYKVYRPYLLAVFKEIQIRGLIVDIEPYLDSFIR